MTTTPRPHGQPPSDEAVTWFGASRRTIGGQPDSRYGWLPMANGLCIVKAMDPELVAYNRTLLDHERRMLQRLHALGAPVPELLDLGRDDWLVTRFAGLSLQRLEHPGGLHGVPPHRRFAFAERLATWVHLLRRLQPMADAGVLAVDLYEANVVVPLTEGISGQLRLHEAAVIDHAYTLEAGMAMCRPVWIDRDMARIAPELREALRRDQEALMQHFRKVGAALPGYSRLPGSHDAHSRRVWAEYRAPQALQHLLDAGELNRDHAMQFAAATAISGLLQGYPDHPDRPALARVLRRMTEATASQRYATLSEAAEALGKVLEAIPMVSQYRYERLTASDLAIPIAAPEPDAAVSGPTAEAASEDSVSSEPGRGATGLPVDSNERPRGPARSPGHFRWLYAALAAGAAIGAAVPLPW